MKNFEKFKKVLIDEKITTSKDIELILETNMPNVKFETKAVINNLLTHKKLVEIKKLEKEIPMYFLDVAIIKKKIDFKIIENLSEKEPNKKEQLAQYLLDKGKCDLSKLLEISTRVKGVKTNDGKSYIYKNR